MSTTPAYVLLITGRQFPSVIARWATLQAHPVCNFYHNLPDGAALQTSRRCWSHLTLQRMLNNVIMTNNCSKP